MTIAFACPVCGEPCTGFWRFLPHCERCAVWEATQPKRLGPAERLDREIVRRARRIGFDMPDAEE